MEKAAVDALRGLIMMLMAVDHASATIARQHSAEFWSGAMTAHSAAFPFVTRWITHLCAPGFFFLMGAGAYWSGASMKRTVWRGAVLVLMAQFVELPLLFVQTLLKPAAVTLSRTAEPMVNDGTGVWYGLITLTGLGLVLMACGLLLKLRPWMWAAVALLCVAATNSALRAAGGWGNIRMARDGGWMEFLNNVKYPPSAVFLAMTLGVDLLLLGLVVRLPAAWKEARSPLMVFGQTALFYYAAHLAVLLVMAFVLFREPGSLEMAWVMWAAALVALYPLCRWYRGFKRGKARESVWRML
jgi:uncharacterized membrane protein